LSGRKEELEEELLAYVIVSRKPKHFSHDTSTRGLILNRRWALQRGKFVFSVGGGPWGTASCKGLHE